MALEVFYSYAHEDEPLRIEIEKQLSLLQRNGFIIGWHDRQIGAGQDWRDQIDSHIRSAHIILLLVSPDFIASDYCYGTEMRIALERQRNHEAIVIPILLRPIDWRTAPFSHLQALPSNAVAITKWDNADQAIADVARGIRQAVTRFHAPEPAPNSPVALVDQYVPQPRVVDAAIPAHIVKGLGTRLLVLIRLPDSAGLFGVLQEEEDEARPEDVRSRPFKMIFPIGPIGKPEPLKVTVKVTSPDFSPPEQSKNIFVPPDADSDVCPFMLTPINVGRLNLLVELQWEDAVRGHRTLLTRCVSEAAEVPAQREMNLVQMHIAGDDSPAAAIGGPLQPPASAPSAVLNPPAPSREYSEAAPVAASSPRPDFSRTGSSAPMPSMPPAPSPRPPSLPPSVSASSGMPPPPPMAAARAGSASGSRWFKSPLVMALLCVIPVAAIGYHFLPTSSKPVDGTLTASTPPPNSSITSYPTNASPAPPPMRNGSAPHHPRPSQPAGSHVDGSAATLGSPHESTPSVPPGSIAFSGQVINARTNDYIAHARVIVFLDGRPSSEQFTDSRGRFFFNLGEIPQGTGGLLYSSAPNFTTLKRNFVITGSSMSYDLPLQPANAASSSRH